VAKKKFNPGSDWKRLAIRQAKRAGMFILFEKLGADAKWLVYDLLTGSCVLTWFPRTASWRAGDSSGTEKDFEKVLRIAKEQGVAKATSL
jgi:hypothetical protein